VNAATFLVGLQIESDLALPEKANFFPPTWPPSSDFPVVIDRAGAVVSQYGDSVWDLGPWSDVATVINFGDGKTKGAKISRENADVFRAVTAWWLWGPRGCRSPRSLRSKHETIKRLFVVCTEAGISATELYRFPRVIEQLAATLAPSKHGEAVALLTDLWATRETLGFFILDDGGLAQFAALGNERNSVQTAYIPPRIWAYQVTRLRECLDDFIAHREKIEGCYRFCLEAYAINYGGSLANAFGSPSTDRAPFNPSNLALRPNKGSFHGAFRLTARRFGIEELLDRWVNTSDKAGIKALSSYLSLVTQTGIAYTLNFSLMRINEATSLRSSCHRVERDAVGEDVHLISGVTTKTIVDPDAQWIVCPGVQIAVEAMRSVALLRMEAATHDPALTISDNDRRNPLLRSWAYEPWGSSPRSKASKKRNVHYSSVISSWPKLFDVKQLRITQADLAVAQQITFNLDPDKFRVGSPWPFAFHQLRRTGAVNMLGSGLVSDSTLQYQLKHARRAMSRYYGQNYYRLTGTFDDETRGVYLKEMYRTLVREFESLQSPRFVSPHGEKRKLQIVSPISERDHAGLIGDARAGRISYRENFLGGCAKPGIPCELGGISNVSGCMGHGAEKPCEHLLLDREKKTIVMALREVTAARHGHTATDSQLWQSQRAQLDSMERALNVLDSV